MEYSLQQEMAHGSTVIFPPHPSPDRRQLHLAGEKGSPKLILYVMIISYDSCLFH